MISSRMDFIVYAAFSIYKDFYRRLNSIMFRNMQIIVETCNLLNSLINKGFVKMYSSAKKANLSN